MKLINGTDIIDNSPNEKAGELAEAIFDDVVFLLDLESKCIDYNEDGDTFDTEYGQDLFNGIYEQCMNYFEKEDIKPQPKDKKGDWTEWYQNKNLEWTDNTAELSIKPQPKEPIAYMYERPDGSAKLFFDRQSFNKKETQIKEIPLYRGEDK